MYLETLRCKEGVAEHLLYHQRRLDHTLRQLGITASYDLRSLVTPPLHGLYRCRFIYDAQGFDIEYHPYTPRKFSTLRAVFSDTVYYPLKTIHRQELDHLYALRGECDDVVIVRNGFLTDTTVANIALFDGKRWLTPQEPLLKGTTRARLIDEGLLIPAPLRTENIVHAQKIALFNALIGFVEVENGIII